VIKDFSPAEMDFKLSQIFPTTDVTGVHKTSALTFSNITTTVDFAPSPPKEAEKAAYALIELSKVFTMNVAPSQVPGSTVHLKSAQRMTCQHGPDAEATAELERYCKHDATDEKATSTRISEKCTTCDIAAANNGNESIEMDDNNSASNQCMVHQPAEATADKRPDELGPIIVDMNQGVPILIDSDDEDINPYRFGGDTEPASSVVSGDEQYTLPPNRNKRPRAEVSAGSVSWADPDFEEDLLKKALHHFEMIQSDWKKLRDFQELASMSKVKRFDQTIIEVAKTENQTISHADAVLLCDLFEEMETEALSKLAALEDKKAVVFKLSLFLRGLQNDTLMTEIVEGYPGHDNEEDSDYRPAKGRRPRTSRKKPRFCA
jgi:hypothetical protein